MTEPQYPHGDEADVGRSVAGQPGGAEPQAADGAERQAPGGASFEQALAELEQVVERLERGELSLDEALAAFQRGIDLVRRCTTKLDEAERKVELLVASAADGTLQTKPFAADEDATA